MILEDFEYNSELLSDKGCMICSITTSNNDAVSMGATLTFDSIVNNATNITENLRANYSENISVTFDICKKECKSGITTTFTKEEISHFKRWLNRKSTHKFIPIYDNDESYDMIYYYGTFTQIDAIVLAGEIVGLTLTFTSNAPWGFVDNTDYIVNITEANGTFSIFSESDEIGYCYPDEMVITCNADGDLKIDNNLDTKSFKVANCKSGEVLTLDCANKILTSSISHNKLYNDFNYFFPRIVVNEALDNNIFTVSIPCSIRIAYTSTRKVGIIV